MCPNIEKKEDTQNDNKYNELLNYIMKENEEFKKQILEIIINKKNLNQQL